MLTFAQHQKTGQSTASPVSNVPDRAHPGHSSRANSISRSQWTTGNQAVQRPSEENFETIEGGSTSGRLARPGHDFSRISVYPRAETKSVDSKPQASQGPVADGEEKKRGSGSIIIETDSPDGGKANDGGAPAQAPPAAPKKKAGVESFVVTWAKNPAAGPTIAKLRLDAKAKFKKDATYDPAVAEYRQNVADDFEITDGPNKGVKHSQQLKDDHYSRADDTGGHTINDVDFQTNDNPGNSTATPIDKDDVIDYTFTAEQMIIDTSDGNKVVEKRGPHTGTIKGKDPRTFGGVPASLS
jgi:hypothetical protein